MESFFFWVLYNSCKLEVLATINLIKYVSSFVLYLIANKSIDRLSMSNIENEEASREERPPSVVNENNQIEVWDYPLDDDDELE